MQRLSSMNVYSDTTVFEKKQDLEKYKKQLLIKTLHKQQELSKPKIEYHALKMKPYLESFEQFVSLNQMIKSEISVRD